MYVGAFLSEHKLQDLAGGYIHLCIILLELGMVVCWNQSSCRLGEVFVLWYGGQGGRRCCDENGNERRYVLRLLLAAGKDSLNSIHDGIASAAVFSFWNRGVQGHVVSSNGSLAGLALEWAQNQVRRVEC